MADEEMVEPDEKDLKIKSLESELEQHKKLFNIHRAGLQPYLDGIVKEIVSKLFSVFHSTKYLICLSPLQDF